MADISLSDSSVSIDINTTGTSLAMESPVILSLISHSRALSNAVPVSKIVLTSSSGSNPNLHLYKINASDGRIWKQSVDIQQGIEASMTFDVGSYWKVSEFEKQRSVREIMIVIARDHAASSVEVNFST